jgi:transcriptional regulator with XRE-family HTH domain
VLGSELRHERTACGLTQAALGDPLTRAFVSAVERGRTMPSLPALELMLRRVDVPMSTFFARVEARMVDQDLTAAYDLGRGDGHP